MPRNSWNISTSDTCNRTNNPIRKIVDNMKLTPHPDKAMIPLSIGDPTVFGNLPLIESGNNSIIELVKAGKKNGYPHSCGYADSREAIAKKYTQSSAPLAAEDVIITSGCSHALDIAITALANPGDNILIPCPGFSLYETLANSKGIKIKEYKLKPEKLWQIDLENLEAQIDDRTTAILINNPSNPCGSVFPEDHLEEILKIAEKYFLPIISDEIYADMAFSPSVFHALAPLSKNVPILTTGGLAKQYLVPGWRVGWLLVHDRNDVFKKEVRNGLNSLTQLILGANSIAQAAIPAILENTDKKFYDEVLEVLQGNAAFSYEKLCAIPGLKPVLPQGAMYMMVEVDLDYFKDIENDFDFTQKLVAEQSVFCLPGKCFKCPNFFRIVYTAPIEKLEIAYVRMAEFCAQHKK